VLDRLIPRLSAVEQTEVNELDKLSREEIEARMAALLHEHPGLLARLIALEARNQKDSGPSVPEIVQVVRR
jgi:BMFP domain-containing protein YqiC